MRTCVIYSRMLSEAQKVASGALFYINSINYRLLYLSASRAKKLPRKFNHKLVIYITRVRSLYNIHIKQHKIGFMLFNICF